MKKRLEAELISIAHRVLKLKGKAELDQLYAETRKLLEVLSVLKFVEENIDVVRPKMDVAAIEKKLENSLTQEPAEETIQLIEKKFFIDAKTDLQQESTDVPDKNVANPEMIVNSREPKTINEAEIESEALLTSKNEVLLPVFDKKDTVIIEQENTIDRNKMDQIGFDFEKNESPITFDKPNQPKMQQISFEELLGHQISEPIFDKKQDIVPTLNDTFSKNTPFGLNDKIGFVKNLFDDSEEDFNRVVSQIGTFATFGEAESFVNELVKPDYNNWENKDNFEKRFMEIIEKKFL